jgi:hypothetical protein
VADDLQDALAAIHAAGGRLTLFNGSLRIDVDRELPDEVWASIATHREELIATLAGDRPIWTDDPIWPERTSEAARLLPTAGVDCCDRCRSTETVSQQIHGGRSVRLDCAACGRFRKFTVWHGVTMP